MSNVKITEENQNLETSSTILRDRILCQRDLVNILPFGKTKIQKLLNENQLPMVRVGKDYITTFDILQDWIRENIGSEIYF